MSNTRSPANAAHMSEGFVVDDSFNDNSKDVDVTSTDSGNDNSSEFKNSFNDNSDDSDNSTDVDVSLEGSANDNSAEYKESFNDNSTTHNVADSGNDNSEDFADSFNDNSNSSDNSDRSQSSTDSFNDNSDNSQDFAESFNDNSTDVGIEDSFKDYSKTDSENDNSTTVDVGVTDSFKSWDSGVIDVEHLNGRIDGIVGATGEALYNPGNLALQGDGNVFSIDQALTMYDADVLSSASVTSNSGWAMNAGEIHGGEAYATSGGDVTAEGKAAVDAGLSSKADALSNLEAFNQNIAMGANVQYASVDMTLVGGSDGATAYGDDA